MNDFNGPYNEILPGQTGVEAAHRPRVGKWRRTHTTHPDDLYEDDYVFRIHYLFKLLAFRLIIRIFNYSCEIHVYEKFPKQENW